ncbi:MULTISPECIES: hypothetical protein [unclassified Bradyrhizobium]|uniref:hypothetical protein n=1 Tax=Bradyrhizobium TaxID=374 RepID=UPI0028E564AD|nr:MULTISPECIES: hypothetical protein [unclassified Bradyrhizobium]
MDQKIEIMRADPVVVRNGQKIEITGRQRELFRLLILNDGRTVSNELIAQLRDTDIDSARGKIRDLREQLRKIGSDDLIHNDRSAGYRALVKGWHVDAHEFRDTIDPMPGAFDGQLGQNIDSENARLDIPKLKRVLAFWHENPAIHLPVETNLESRFDSLKKKAEDRLLISQLCSQQQGLIHEAIQELEHRSRRAADDITWELLLLAYHATGKNSQLHSTWQRIVEHYEGRTPKALSSLRQSIGNGKFKNPFRSNVTSPNESTQDDDVAVQDKNAQTLQSLCSMLGITTASQMRLLDSHLTPLACIRRTRSRLYFSGVLASKWVIEPAVRSKFNELLTRLDKDEGDVRFLMINPNGDGFRRLNELREGNISAESIAPMKILAERHRSLQVRLYNGLPSFRIVVIDDDVVSFSPYRLAADAYLASNHGWEAPHVVLDPMATYPLAEAFLLLFNETWANAVPIGDVL